MNFNQIRFGSCTIHLNYTMMNKLLYMTNCKSGLSTNSSFSINRLILNLTEPFLWIHFRFYFCSLF